MASGLSAYRDIDSTGTAAGSYSSGYGHGGHKGADCCPLVVDPLTVAALLGFIAGAAALLQNLIATTLAAGGGRKKRSSSDDSTSQEPIRSLQGNQKTTAICRLCGLPK